MFATLPIVAVAFVSFFLCIPEIYLLLFRKTIYIPILSDLLYNEKITIILTYAITVFAAVEGYSTYLQVVLQRNRNIIEDARNELEKAYGPLYTLLNRQEEIKEEAHIELNEDEKTFLDNILATYPFMFSSEIYSLWRKEIQSLEPLHKYLGRTLIRTYYHIPLEFRDKINEEYDRRVKRYNEVLKKGERGAS